MAQKYIIGDLVFHYLPKSTLKKYVKVYVCSTNNVLSLEDMSGNLYDYIGELYPIPLTPEILEKNGWKKQNKVPINCTILYNLHNEITIGYNTNSKTFVYDFGINKLLRIRFIHQLQHLLFGLGLNSEMEV